ncbi:MAG TPA: prepilin-type N-terminal cleavage/methylation domain-containing protein [Longimicrobiaceae bacterium]|nr:prepilin-type N-terminal cleavage/methylation domain-containing protein [Longimicrobiaceae bacterium]
MGTENRSRGSQAGFTLIEVLFAMLILAVGLLGMEALGIGAARAVNPAQRQGAFVTTATDTLERTLNRIRRGEVVNDGTFPYTAGNTDTVRLVISTNGRVRTVAVTVVPNPASRVLSRSDSLRMVGYVFR